MKNIDPKILCVIPARGGSVRVKNKNVRLLKGRPLMAYTLRSAKEAQRITLNVVSTDDKMIADVARQEGLKVIDRPVEYAASDSPIYFALRHAVSTIKQAEGWLPDIVVWLQPNVPFRESGLIDEVVQKLIDNFNRADSVVTVYEVDQHPEAMKVINDGFLEYRENPKKAYFLTQRLPKCYMLDGSVMAMKTKVLMDEAIPMDNGHFYLGKIMPYIHSFPYNVEVDNEEDFFMLEYILDRGLIH